MACQIGIIKTAKLNLNSRLSARTFAHLRSRVFKRTRDDLFARPRPNRGEVAGVFDHCDLHVRMRGKKRVEIGMTVQIARVVNQPGLVFEGMLNPRMRFGEFIPLPEALRMDAWPLAACRYKGRRPFLQVYL